MILMYEKPKEYSQGNDMFVCNRGKIRCKASEGLYHCPKSGHDISLPFADVIPYTDTDLNCYTSEVEVTKYKRSINYLVAKEDCHQKWTLVEYRLRWVVDDQGKFLKFEQPQLLGDYKVFGVRIRRIKPFITSDKIQGVLIETNRRGKFVLPRNNGLRYEFKDT
jgi:hypothetical protein